MCFSKLPETFEARIKQQKFHRNKQAGGGAYIPASLKITGPRQHMAFVLGRLRATLHECENGDEMSIDMFKE